MDGTLYDGPTVRKIRQTAGIRMVDLARAANLSYGHLRMFEKAGRKVSPETAHRLAIALTNLSGRTVDVDDFTPPGAQQAEALSRDAAA